ncbi:MAG: hypothetical protein AAGC63_07925, partial [Propionicimonas sp.]
MNVIDEAIQHLRQWHSCPSCGAGVTGETCTGCGIELTGEPARLLRVRSEDAARALELRQQALATLVAARPVPVAAAVPVGGAAPLTPTTAGPATPDRRTPVPVRREVATTAPSQPNPVAVFSAVGVGALLAGAVVFASLVPADPAVVRGTLLGVIAASVLAMLALRKRRPVSAAAVAVGTVALCLLVIGLFVRPLAAGDALLVAALSVAGLAAGLGAAGFALRLRPWVSGGVLLAPVAAALAAGALIARSAWWWAALAVVAAIAVAAAGRWAALRWQDGRPGPLPLAAERTLLSLGSAVTLVGLLGLTLQGAVRDSAGAGAVAGGILLLAAGAAALHDPAPDAGWRRTAGVVAVLAAVAAVLGWDLSGLAACAAAGVGWIVLAVASRLPALRDGRLAGVLNGGWV